MGRNEGLTILAGPAHHDFLPVEARYDGLDLCRGVALFGVLVVNVLSGFRTTLFEHLSSQATDLGLTNQATEMLVAALIEFKAFALFAFLFGVGVAIQQERATSRHVNPSVFLARRFLILLCFGLTHMFLIWSGDILTLYAVCGLILILFARLPSATLAILGVAAVVSGPFLPFPDMVPSAERLQADAITATQEYLGGTFWPLVKTRTWEVRELIAGLLVFSLPKTLGMMLLGMAAWKAGIVRCPQKHLALLRTTAVLGGVAGLLSNAVLVGSRYYGLESPLPIDLIELLAQGPLALSYGSVLFLIGQSEGRTFWAVRSALVAAGRMSLTNYLMQSVVLGFLFYGYGFGLMCRLGSFQAFMLAVCVYAAQIAVSRIWLERFRFGPAEWAWRSLTYERWQRLRH